MEHFDNFGMWIRALTIDGCGLRRDSRGIWWAENWEGKSCGEFDPVQGEGFLDYSKA